MLFQVKRALLVRTRLQRLLRWAVRYQCGWLIVHDAWLDRRFGAWCGGTVASPFAAQGAVQTQSATYRSLARLFSHPGARIGPADVLVDVGCGKGRVINHWLRCGLGNRMVGIERTPAVAEQAQARLAQFGNVEILVGDAVAVLPADGTLFFLFNPFGHETMEALVRQLLVHANTQTLRVVYLNPRHQDVFDRSQWAVTGLSSDSPDAAVLICRHGAVAR
jgi:SAM-dependent methyltransferase